jgi:hypothetical protein
MRPSKHTEGHTESKPPLWRLVAGAASIAAGAAITAWCIRLIKKA